MKRWVSIVAVILVPGAAYAQDPLPGWPGLETSGLPSVRVVEVTGQETRGRLLRLDRDALVLLIDGAERRFEAARVRRLDKRGDSLRNGAIMGAVVGVVLGAVSASLSDCPGSDPGGGCPGARASLLTLSAGLYAAIGTAIDALVVGHTTLYVAPPTSTATTRAPAARRALPLRPVVRLRFSW